MKNKPTIPEQPINSEMTVRRFEFFHIWGLGTDLFVLQYYSITAATPTGE
jgi:hypothetical protein